MLRTIILCVLFGVSTICIPAQTTSFTYQGKLTDAGNPPTAQYDLILRLFDASGTQIGTDQAKDDVQVTIGIFTVALDFGASPFTGTTADSLEIAVRPGASTGAYTTLTPRQPLTSSPYSVKSFSSTSSDVLFAACILCVTDAKILSIDGSKVTGTVANATNATNAANAATAGNVTGVVAIANGGAAAPTPPPVSLVTDIAPFAGSGPANLTNVDGTLFFTANDGVRGVELWKSNGTAAGTVLVKDINPFGSSINAGVVGLTNVNGILFFPANDGNGFELWRSDGTAAGTFLVKDINPGSASSNPINQAVVNGVLFFFADDGVRGRELWRSDGTAAGTVLVADINAGIGNGVGPSTDNLANVNGTLYFQATDATRGTEIWSSDGTAAGTVLVRDWVPGIGSSFPYNFKNVGGTLFFGITSWVDANNVLRSNTFDLFTLAGLVRDINPTPSAALVAGITNINGTAFFVADNGVNGRELWRSDGSEAGTMMVKDIQPSTVTGTATNLTDVNGTLFFVISDGISTGQHGAELWKSDGTAGGTVLVKDIYPGPNTSNPGNLTNVNGLLFFAANDSVSGFELWMSDGTEPGTILVADINPGAANSLPSNLANVNGTLFFQANDGVRGAELWASVSNIIPRGSARADFDDDGKTDLSVFRPSEGNWYLNRSTAGFAAINWGISTDTLVPGDYDNDGKSDTAVFRPTATVGQSDFFVLNSNGFTISGFEWGITGDIPVVGDYDADGKTDIAVWRPSDQKWYIRNSANNTARIDLFGSPGDVPLVMDYDGDGKDNLAVFRPGNNTWYLARSTGTPATNFVALPFGTAGDKLVPADYDGDGKDDVAVYRPSNGTWYIMRSSNGAVDFIPFGNSTDIPVPGDYDGDGKDDVAVYRDGTWYAQRSTSGLLIASFGLSTDTAIPAKYIP